MDPAGHDYLGEMCPSSRYAVIDKIEDVAPQSIDIARLMEGLTRAANPMNVVILDACRENPFGKDFRVELVLIDAMVSTTSPTTLRVSLARIARSGTNPRFTPAPLATRRSSGWPRW
mgnify:CR=1 FL=1